MIQNVIFDIGKVLIGFDWRAYLRSLFDEETAERTGRAMFRSGNWVELDRAVLTVEEIVGRFISADPGVESQIREAFGRIGECVARRDWVIPLIRSLKDRGYNVLFLSNMSEHVMGSNPEAFDFVRCMDGGIFSCDVNAVKPDPEIYHRLMGKFDLVPEECLFIDDHPENIAMARRLGMKGIVYRDHKQMKADLEKALVKDATHHKITVVCYGDSNTYGYDPVTRGRYPDDKRWTSLLADKLGGQYEVIAEGLNGRTTAYDRSGEEWKNGARSLVSCLGTRKPVDYLVIMLGTNDCNATLGLSAEEIAQGMEKLVGITEAVSPDLQGYIPEIIAVAPAPIGDGYQNSPFAWELSPESYSNSHALAGLYRDIAERHMIRFADAVSADVSDSDCEHLTEQGHSDIAELIWSSIKHPEPLVIR